MWRMLTGRAEDLEIRLAEHEAEDTRGSAHWLADYTFRTGRKVHNDVRAEFRFENGLITEHRDSFSFYAWARQALGPDRARARLDADRALEGPERGPLRTRRVPRSLAARSARGPDRSQPVAPDERAPGVHERPVEPEAAARAGVGGDHARLGAQDAATVAVGFDQEVEAGLHVARLGEAWRTRPRPRGEAHRWAARSVPRLRTRAPTPTRRATRSPCRLKPSRSGASTPPARAPGERGGKRAQAHQHQEHRHLACRDRPRRGQHVRGRGGNPDRVALANVPGRDVLI